MKTVLAVMCLVVAFATAQYPEPTKYDFKKVGCFAEVASQRDLPHRAIEGSNNPSGIDLVFGFSLSQCARACLRLRNPPNRYKYAGVHRNSDNQMSCYCGNTFGLHGQLPDSECNIPCPGDSSEICGGVMRNMILDISPIPDSGIVCPPSPNPQEGSLCCPERASHRPIDQSLRDFVDLLFPRIDFSKIDAEQYFLEQFSDDPDRARYYYELRKEYLNGDVPAFIYLTEAGNFSISVVADGAGYRNQIGYFLVGPDGTARTETFEDIFGDSSMNHHKGPNVGPWRGCADFGLTATRGPFPAGTGIGFFIHANGANSGNFKSGCRTQAVKDCIVLRGPRDYACYRPPIAPSGCSMDAFHGSRDGFHVFTSQRNLNPDDLRHVAVIQHPDYGLIIGFEDLMNLGDQDFNDAMFIVEATTEVTGEFPTFCEPSCNSLNGRCNTGNGVCECNDATDVTFDSRCNCDGCPDCSSTGGTCKCSGNEQTCVCKPGFFGPNCACTTDAGLCYQVPGSWNCSACVCHPGYSQPVIGGLIGGIYQVNFGPSGSTSLPGYLEDNGATLSGSSFGSFGWSVSHTSLTVLRSHVDPQHPNSAFIRIRRKAKWTIFLQPNADYDVSVTFGSHQDSSHSLDLVGSQTFTLLSSRQLGVNVYITETRRVRSDSQGRISLVEPDSGEELTRITSVLISVPPCSCIACSGGCNNGTCNCYDGTCSCPTGFGGNNCERCLSNRWGPTCQPCPTCNGKGTCNQGLQGDGKCTCQTGWTGPNCEECAPGFYGPNCNPCPNCVPGQGTCDDTISGEGDCICESNYDGDLCQDCASGFGGPNCDPCPECVPGQGSCSEGISGTGLCVCEPGFDGPTCSDCASNHFGNDCELCPTCNGKGSCSQGNDGTGDCTCITGWTGTNCEDCADGYTGTNCDPCHPSCETCSGTSSDQCLTCPSNRLTYGTSCVSSCPPGTYLSGSSCLECHSTCETCYGGGENQCSTCKTTMESNQFYEDGKCVSSCSSNYFLTGFTCNPCSSNCATCTDTSSTCTSCPSSTNLHDSQCVSSCPPGTFAQNNVCETCSPNCETCSASATNCVTCPSNKLLHSGTCVEECPPTFFANDPNCSPCQNPCSGCSGSATTCESCIPGYLFVPATNECVTNCADKTYPDDDDDVCHDCQEQCATCTNAASCTSCPDGEKLQNGNCVENCDSHYYESGDNCFPCDPNCDQCAGSSTTCTSCTGNLALSEDKCVSNCPPGTYKNGNTCSPCGGNCETCTGGDEDDCLTCEENFALQGTTCQEDCDSHFYEDDNGVCRTCHPTCETCSTGGSGGCTSCPTGLLMYGTSCVSQCPSGTYEDNGECKACNDPCSTCENSADNCLSCIPGETPLLQGNGCVSECEDDEYVNSNTCLPCHDTCSSCTSGSSQACTSCPNGRFLLNNQCVPPSSCPSNTFANSATNTCDDCDNSCSTCSGPSSSDCTSCVDSFLNEASCLEDCPPGKFKNSISNTCDNCFFTCDTCSGATQNDCDSCTGNLNLHDDKCVSSCPPGTFSQNNECLPCNLNCQTCVDQADHCLTCEDGWFILNGVCHEECPEGYYGEEEDSTCEPCAPARNCQNGGQAICQTGHCNCTDTGYAGAFCDCSTASCPLGSNQEECSGVAVCSCGTCSCDPRTHWGPACECIQCPRGNSCSNHGTCNCDGTCTCDFGFVGADCNIPCRFDECGVCFGDGRTCAGCDGVPNSGKVFDACNVCGGDNSTCAGCDGIPNSMAEVDRCGVCNGDGLSCIDQIKCDKRMDCESCNQGVGQTQRRECGWCNSTIFSNLTQSFRGPLCIPLASRDACEEFVEFCTAPSGPPSNVDDLTGNESSISTGAIAGAVVGGVIAAAAVALLVFMAKKGKGPLYFEVPFEENPAAFNNPLYQEYSPQMENPLYQPPSGNNGPRQV